VKYLLTKDQQASHFNDLTAILFWLLPESTISMGLNFGPPDRIFVAVRQQLISLI
jgi:hypothetical protein